MEESGKSTYVCIDKMLNAEQLETANEDRRKFRLEIPNLPPVNSDATYIQILGVC